MLNPISVVGVDVPEAISVAIPTDATGLSASIDLNGKTPVAIIIGGTWATADITFKGSADGTNFYDVYYNSSGTRTEYVLPAAASSFLKIPYADLLGIHYLKIRSGTTGTPVDQTGSPTITLVTAP